MSALKTDTLSDAVKTPPAPTGGEVFFDRIAYLGIGGAVNAAVSIYLTDLTTNKAHVGSPLYEGCQKLQKQAVQFSDKFGPDAQAKAGFEQIAHTIRDSQPAHAELFTPGHDKYNQAQFFFNHGKETGDFSALSDHIDGIYTAAQIREARDFLVGQERIQGLAAGLAQIGMLSTGGFITMIPIKLMEDHKRPLVQFFDEKILDPLREITGKAPQSAYMRDEMMQARAARYEYLDNAPKQNWLSLIGSRIGSVAIVIPTLLAIHGSDNVIKSGLKPNGGLYANPDPEVGFGGIEHHSKAITNTLVTKAASFDGVKNILGKFYDLSSSDGMQKLQNHTNLLAQDVTYSFIAANITYGLSRLLAPIIGTKTQENDQPQPVIDKAEKQGVTYIPKQELALA